MKFSFSALAFAASLAFVNAQDLSGIPTCALGCFATAVPAANCGLTDTKCQCTTGQAKITEEITKCVPGKCSAEDIAKLGPAVQAICAGEGYTITNLPTTLPTASGASAASITASVTGTASGAAQSTGAAVANVANVANVGVLALGFAAAWL